MEFGEIAVADAQGTILAHTVKHAGGVFKKGRVLSSADVAVLQQAGAVKVFAARLGEDDVPEDVAAAAIARVIGGEGCAAQAPFTGRANLHAGLRGLAVIDGERVKAINRLHESLTLATAANFSVVDMRQMVATVKVIPFAVPRAVLDKALAIIGSEPLIAVKAFQNKQVGLVISRVAQTKASIIAKSEAAMRERIAALGGSLANVLVVDHAIGAVWQAIAELQARACDPILLFGASAIVDRGDVIPAALVAAGGAVIHLGMPVDPGNLMMLGKLGDVPVIGVPSCARSPKLNGFDWVLERVMADYPVTALDIMDMGAGGLLAEIPTRPSPREGKSSVQRAPRVTAIVLAAGQSARMGTNKLLADLGGEPMIRRTVSGLLASAAEPVIVVTGRDGDHVVKALSGLRLSFVHNPDFAHGLSTSLRCGLEAVAADADAVVVCLGDMPLVNGGTIGRLIAAFNPAEHRSICVAVHRGQRGNPVLWGRQHFAALASLGGDHGARMLFDQYADELVEVEMPDRAVLTDIDTPEMLDDFRSGRFPSG